jgi:hypothetical protein
VVWIRVSKIIAADKMKNLVAFILKIFSTIDHADVMPTPPFLAESENCAQLEKVHLYFHKLTNEIK